MARGSKAFDFYLWDVEEQDESQIALRDDLAEKKEGSRYQTFGKGEKEQGVRTIPIARYH